MLLVGTSPASVDGPLMGPLDLELRLVLGGGPGVALAVVPVVYPASVPYPRGGDAYRIESCRRSLSLSTLALVRLPSQ